MASSSSSPPAPSLNLSPFMAKNFTDAHRTDFSQFPGLSSTFNFERLLLMHIECLATFVREHYLLPVGLSLLYYWIVVGAIPKWMSNRQPFNLRLPLFYWNLVLATFSILGTIRTLPELVFMIRNEGWFGSTCDNRYIDDPRFFLWLHLFTLSKVFEFGDTLFIVLRKQRLLALHWVHHMLTLIYTWLMMQELPSNSRWLCTMNFAIHSIMYTYYAAMASGTRVPRPLAKMITSLQILQMVVGLVTETITLYYPERLCRKPKSLAILGFSVYFIFFLLFVRFFVQRYYGKSLDSVLKQQRIARDKKIH